MQEALCYDDVLLVPADNSKVDSRSLIDTSMILGNPNNPKAWKKFSLPIIIAPMEYISSTDMLKSIFYRGGLGFVQRHQNISLKHKQIELLKNNAGVSISISDCSTVKYIDYLLENHVNTILIDTAFGHTDATINGVKKLRSLVPDEVHIMVGNVSSYGAYINLMDAGADSVRVGIGGGAACMTRIKTGFGPPVLSSIMDIYEKVKSDSVNGIVADGGIKNYGDIVKAFAAGASAVMMGSMFAGHKECDGEPGMFRGLASEGIQKNMCIENPYNEGEEGRVSIKGSVLNTLSDMKNSISSGCSYGGVNNLSDLAKDAEFIKVSNASLKESYHRLEK